jgi:hypothetical protein
VHAGSPRALDVLYRLAARKAGVTAARRVEKRERARKAPQLCALAKADVGYSRSQAGYQVFSLLLRASSHCQAGSAVTMRRVIAGCAGQPPLEIIKT